MNGYKKARKANDEKYAQEAMKVVGVVEAFGDDGNLHIKCENQEVADVVFEKFGGLQPSDGRQEGAVCVWVGDKMVHESM
jgi:hypothetical protein